jgi:uncharacterized membrane protein
MTDPTIWSKMHGATTHFPIALMLVATICDTAAYASPRDGELRRNFRFCGTITVLLSAISSYAAVLSGLVSSKWSVWGHATLLRHHQFIWPAFALMTGLATWRVLHPKEPTQKAEKIYIACLFLTAALVSAAGYWGGELLYQG